MLEQRCEMVEDTLFLPKDLPANVIVPIVNFMYTGTLKFNNQLYEKLLKTSREMKLSVLSKLLEFHRPALLQDHSQTSVAAKPMPKVLYRQTLPAKLVPRNFDPYSNTLEPTSDPLAITKIERPPTSSIRVIDSINLCAKPRRTWDARVEHIPSRHIQRRIALPKPPVPVRNTNTKRMTYQKRERLVRPMIVQQISESRTSEVKVESIIDDDPLSNSLSQDICDDNATEFSELSFKIESVRTMQSNTIQAPKRLTPVPETPKEEPKRLKKEENVLEISDESFDGTDDDFLLSLKDFGGQNVGSI